MEANIKVERLRGVTLKVNIFYTRRFWVRLWLAKLLFAMAAWVLGCDFEVEEAKTNAAQTG